jgi:hypothetical protein
MYQWDRSWVQEIYSGGKPTIKTRALCTPNSDQYRTKNLQSSGGGPSRAVRHPLNVLWWVTSWECSESRTIGSTETTQYFLSRVNSRILSLLDKGSEWVLRTGTRNCTRCLCLFSFKSSTPGSTTRNGMVLGSMGGVDLPAHSVHTF